MQGPAVRVVLRYGDDLEPCSSLADAEAFVRAHLPDLPDAVWDEGEDCEARNEYEVVSSDDTVRLVQF